MHDISRTIEHVLTAAANPAVLCSWGRDSSLLLHYALDMKPDVSIYYFGDNLPTLAEQLILERDVTICSFAPMRSFIKNETLIDEYSFNGQSVPMLSEIVFSDTCAHKHLKPRIPSFFFPHDTVLWGYRKADRHPLFPDLQFEREIQIGHTKFVAPLYDLTTDQVLNVLDALELEYVSDFPVEICENCMNALERQTSH